ncbi:MAG: RND transporter, partial [Chthoniobacteraceae bacterium]
MNTQASTSTKPTRPAAERPRKKPPLRRFIPWIIGAGLLMLIVAGFWPKPIEVEVAAVTRGPLTVSVLEEGKTRIRHRYIVSMPIAGFLNRVELRAGAAIEAGKTVLATIEPQAAGFLDPRARAEAEARLQAAEAGEKRAQAEVDRAQSALDLAIKDRERADELKRTGAISAKEWDAAQNHADVLERAVRATEFALQVAQF